ncbi:MAG: response regulator [Polyangiales bacterium]
MTTPLLIVDDDPLVLRALHREFRRYAEILEASTVTQALVLLAATPRWRGAIVDYRLPDGNGVAVLAAFRCVAATAPVLMLSGFHEPDVINAASQHGACYAVKPAPIETLRAFGDRLEAEAPIDLIGPVVSELASEFHLTPGEERVLRIAATGVSRESLRARLGITDNTLKSAIRSIVRKCRCFQLADVVRLVHGRVFPH